ncbi:MAG: M20/M25/M40 family metallo-hydrolase [Candidatus Omnitrophica bacterium]|nr:M20/M25/M40 family metallo-hydrolase [Candidatus Omnitrophota bacterium]
MPKKSYGIFLIVIFACFSLFVINAQSYQSEESEYWQKFLLPRPWLSLQANSEQHQPLYLNVNPRQIALNLKPGEITQVFLPESLRERGRDQIRIIQEALIKTLLLNKVDDFEVEAWPIRDDYGQLTWAFARWRKNDKDKWLWLSSKMISLSLIPESGPAPFLPVLLQPEDKDDFGLIFNDILDMKALYDKPYFGDCVWTSDSADDSLVTEAWLPIEKQESYAQRISDEIADIGICPACRVIPQPARLKSKSAVFVLQVRNSEIIFPPEIAWEPIYEKISEAPKESLVVKSWPPDFISKYKNDVLVLDGEEEVKFPITKKKMYFKDKNSIDANNQLEELVDYLVERYRVLRIKTVRQRFDYRGVAQSNLIAIIPGTDSRLRPVLMADHIDTAFCEDIFKDSGKRVSSPGADDNVSSTAVLLRAAEILRDLKPKHPIWLVHFTGEEFPADDLGARFFVSWLLKKRIDIEGLVLMDTIGFRQANDQIFQVNPGDSEESLRLAKIVMDIAPLVTKFKPVLRTRFAQKSYLYNSDGLIFSDNGYPVVYLNEHMNKLQNMHRKGYHDSTDTSKNIDWEYATDIAKVAIETVAILARAQAK